MSRDDASRRLAVLIAWIAAAASAVAALTTSPVAAAPHARPPAHPAKAAPGKPETPAERAAKALAAQLAALDKEESAFLMKGATFAAAKVGRKALALQIKATGPDSEQVQRRKQVLAGQLGILGNFTEQLALARELVATAERLHGRESRELLNVLHTLTAPYWSIGDYEQVDATTQRVLALTRALDGENTALYATQLTAYAAVLSTRGQYAAALQVHEQALQIHEKIERDERQLIAPLLALANAEWFANQRTRAIAALDRAIKIADKPDVPFFTRGSTLWTAAQLYHYGGRTDLARPMAQRAIALYDAERARLDRDAPDGWELPIVLGQLAYMYRQNGALEQAERAFAQANEIEGKRGASTWATPYAEVVRQRGKPREALAILEREQERVTKASVYGEIMLSTTIADVLRELGELPRAERMLTTYRANVEKLYGRRHAMYGLAELTTASVYMETGKLAAAEQLLDHGLELAERDLQLATKSGTEADHAVYFARNNYQLDVALNFQIAHAPRRPSAVRLALTTLLRRKGRVLDAAAAGLTTLRARLSDQDKQLLDELSSTRAQLARLTVASPNATGDTNLAAVIAELEDKIQKLEIEVSKRSAAYRAASQPIVLAPIQKAIPRDARLVEVVNYQPGDPLRQLRAQQVAPPRRYGAYVVARTGDPVFVDLGPAQAIDDAVEQFRKAVADPDNDRAPELGHALYALTIGPLAPALGGATSVLIAPDGALNVVPFSALVDDHGDFLVQRFTFTYLTSGRDLLRVGIRSKAQGGGVMFADPAFDAARPRAKDATAPTRGLRSADLGLQAWKPLPGTAEEADAVGKYLRGLTVFRGPDATETALKAVRGPKILHLATHGFFLRDEAPLRPTDAMPSAVPSMLPTTSTETRENPLLRSGLALAGANQLTSGDDDGILTAMEATGLDLWGTQLVVLSACETGVGKVTNGDGVYGLRRALVIAGAESLMMSLWQVDDAATRDLMAGYYERLTSGHARSTALRETQLAIRAKPKYAHPYYWASFLAAGDDSPIQ